MTDQVTAQESLETKKKANTVLYACALFNLTIGVLYAWSVLTPRLTASLEYGGYGWTPTQAGAPFTVAILFFAAAMLVGGRLQDKIGPRWVVTAGGFLSGLGMIISGSAGNSVMGITFGFGVVSAIGMGFGYGSVSPPALKWFHPSQKGLISGIVVGGFGLSAVFYAPMTGFLLNLFGTGNTLIMLGTATLIIATFIAQFVNNPPPGYVPAAPAGYVPPAQPVKSASDDIAWKDMIFTRRFHMMFLMFVMASSVGVMVIGNMTAIARTQVESIADRPTLLAILVSFLAFTNTVGRIVGGKMSDKIGRQNALSVTFALQMFNMAAFAFYQTIPALLVGIIIVGFCFGTLLSVMPALCADQYGLKNMGMNYGILFLAWGLSGSIAPVMANILFGLTGNFNITYIICAIMMAAMIVVNHKLKKDIEGEKA